MPENPSGLTQTTSDGGPVSSDTFTVEVVYCLPEKQSCVVLQVVEGCTAGAAIKRSALLDKFELKLEGKYSAPIGIFGKQVTPDSLLKPGDRVEIYRPLLLSPTEARRLRAKTLSES
ncbi:MAG: RnfH family protein [Proteobacteria bacterium]|nr:RnfH family protein [Pseudomonadota bacterium]